jgi:hypothetical protein
MDPAGGTAAQSTTNASSSDSASAKPELDMSAINEAIAQTANDPSTAPQQTFDVNEISLDNTPTTDAGLEQQQASNPGMNLANSGAAASATAGAEDKPAAPAAAFVDGDIVDEAPKAEEAPKPAADYDAALNADPLASFEDPAAPAPAAAAPAAAPSGEVDPSTLNDPDPEPTPEPAPAAAAPAVDPLAAAQQGEGVADTNAPVPAPVEKKDEDDDDDDEKNKKKPKKGEIHIKVDFDKILHSNVAIIGIVVGIILILVAVLLIATLS